MDKDTGKPVNMVIDPLLWRALSITSAKLGILKKDAVAQAIREFIDKHDPETLRFILGIRLD